ncbi:hypothetical protein [Pseudomonas putida]|uniref:hypothetical protein n=1 Tax=Pseudomonas putida TaxID=303 RepID=UPI0023646838|nr:hypothetical protein [Pseudomonas putida]MDD2103641.1 hypothetical protein [Pseudomonas putida]
MPDFTILFRGCDASHCWSGYEASFTTCLGIEPLLALDMLSGTVEAQEETKDAEQHHGQQLRRLFALRFAGGYHYNRLTHVY